MHAAIPVLLAMTGLIIAGASRQPIFVVAGLALVTVCHSTIMPAFWCLPSYFLHGAGAAAGTYSAPFCTLAVLAFGSATLLAWLRTTRAFSR